MANPFFPATVQLFSNPDNTNAILTKLRKPSKLPDASKPRKPSKPTRIHPRDIEVTNVNVEPPGPTILASSECLVRWDTRSPETIFREGFRPRVEPATEQWLTSNDTDASDLKSFVSLGGIGTRYIFVSTTRCRRVNNQICVFVPIEHETAKATYAYDIYAPGGIDVNQSLGDHPRRPEHEIAFPGGIRPEFIRSVRRYSGRRVLIRGNPNFKLEDNPDHEVAPPRFEVPRLAWGGGPDDEPVMYTFICDRKPRPSARKPDSRATGPSSSTNTSLAMAASNLSVADHSAVATALYEPEDGDGMGKAGEDKDNYIELMHGPGKFVPVSDIATARGAVRAAFRPPRHPDQAYFFADNQYVKISMAGGATDGTIIGTPQTLYTWISLRNAGFPTVDAVMPVPSTDGQDLFFFSGNKCARISMRETQSEATADTPPDRPSCTSTITESWPSLKEAGFDRVDAVLPSTVENEAYFFRGAKYALVGFDGKNPDRLIRGPNTILDHWPALKMAGFATVDAVLPGPGSAQAYFFSGPRYALIEFTPGSTQATLISGPKDVAKNWPSLAEAYFY